MDTTKRAKPITLQTLQSILFYWFLFSRSESILFWIPGRYPLALTCITDIIIPLWILVFKIQIKNGLFTKIGVNKRLYETIPDKQFDRRNFQKKMLGLGILSRLKE